MGGEGIESLLIGIVQAAEKTFRAGLCGSGRVGLVAWSGPVLSEVEGNSCPLVSPTATELCRSESLMIKDAKYWIKKLNLEPHPEGGFYRQTYKSDLVIPHKALPQFPGPRPASTAIYFLLDGKSFSAFHRLRSDELWHFYVGAPVLVHVISESGEYSKILLGNDPDAGETPQAVVQAGCWFASHVKDRKSFALVGCTVAPGFDFDDFELAKREALARHYPQHRQVIKKLTRD